MHTIFDWIIGRGAQSRRTTRSAVLSRMARGVIASAILLGLTLNSVATNRAERPSTTALALQSQFRLQGRVLKGKLGDERYPLEGVTVSLYGSNDSYPSKGMLLRSALTNIRGSYELVVGRGDMKWEFLHIIPNKMEGFVSVEATSVGGIVRAVNWIEFAGSLQDRNLTGNKFWFRNLEEKGSKPTQRPPAGGNLLEGQVVVMTAQGRTIPMADVIMTLYGGDGKNFPGTLLHQVRTDADGRFAIPVSEEDLKWTSLNLVKTKSRGYVSLETTSAGGHVKNPVWIEYRLPLKDKNLKDNFFLERLPESSNSSKQPQDQPETKPQTLSPIEGWCCLDGKIYHVSERCCERFGGRFFRTREEAEEFCQSEKDVLMIPELKGSNWADYVGKIVTVEGIFARDPLPMLVTELDIVLMNRKMPDDKYIILLGNNAQEIEPYEYGGGKLQLTGVVNAVDDELKYGFEYVGLTVISFEIIERLQPYAPESVPMKVADEPQIPKRNRYAILFGGGIDPANNHIRYWNDLKFMYSTLVNSYGYTSSAIAVLYGSGRGNDNDIPVHYSATKANLIKVFDLLKGITTTKDFIFVFTTNHGGGFYKADLASPLTSSGKFCGRLDSNGDEGTEGLDEKKYKQDFNSDGGIKDKVSWDEELCAWKESIYDDDLTLLLTNLKCDRMVIVLEQCFSGGLIRDMAGKNRIIMSAAGEFEPSWGMEELPYDEFCYHFTCAIRGEDPSGTAVDADTNNDGAITMVEAFNFARLKDTTTETPWYEDSGDGVANSGSIPKEGDGVLGTTTTLE